MHLIRHPKTNWAFLLTLAVCCCLAQSGCSEGDRIYSYRVKRVAESSKSPHAAPSKGANNDRMIAAIVQNGPKTWFFKLTGEKQSVQDQSDSFLEFLNSLQFGEAGDSPPGWDLPEGWRSESGRGMRFATIKIDGTNPPLEISVTSLESGTTSDEFVLSNVNRWRGQLGLPPTTLVGLYTSGTADEQTTQVPLEGRVATVVNLVGTLRENPMGRAPFAGGGRFAGPSAGPTTRPPAGPPPQSAPETPNLHYEMPKGWSPGRAGGMRKVAFEVGQGDAKAEITVIDLDQAAGGLLPNVNRWRGQVELEATTSEQLSQETKTIEMGGLEGKYVALIGPTESILGVIVTHGGKAWFIKLKGDTELAKREQPKFEAFVRSLRFEADEDGQDVK